MFRILINFCLLGTGFLGLHTFEGVHGQIYVDHTISKQSTDRVRHALAGSTFHSNRTYYHALVSEVAKPLLTEQEIQSIHKEVGNLTAVLHIGPMKTGSSSIQASFHSVLGKPEHADRFEDASRAMGTKDLGVWNMIGCFRHPDASVDGFIVCKPEALAEIHQVAARRNNIVISAEYLASPDTNVAALKDFLRPWQEHKVVAYYRRYYDWLNSFHNQGNKKKPTNERHTLIDFLKREQRLKFWWDKMYIMEALKRWGEHFSDVEVFNIHEIADGDVRDSFFCKALPRASNACNTFRTKKALSVSSKSTTPTNPSVSFVYEDLAYYSKEMGLWSEQESGLSLRQVALKAKEHQENDLKLTSYDFGNALECPDSEIADFLLQRSLDAEKELFPKYFAEKGEREIREDFSKQIRTKLCHVHAKAVLDESAEWRAFFKSLNKQ